MFNVHTTKCVFNIYTSNGRRLSVTINCCDAERSQQQWWVMAVGMVEVGVHGGWRAAGFDWDILVYILITLVNYVANGTKYLC